MVKHIIIWDIKEEYSAEKKAEVKAAIKESLESLNGKIEGMTELKVITDILGSSNGDVMLDSVFTDENALKGYQTNPLHVAAAQVVRDNTCARKCIDFEIQKGLK